MWSCRFCLLVFALAVVSTNLGLFLIGTYFDKMNGFTKKLQRQLRNVYKFKVKGYCMIWSTTIGQS